MTTPPYGISPFGFLKKPLEVIKAQIETVLQAEFGEINTQPESVFGQLVGLGSKGLEDVWETIEAVYFSQYPNSATGIALDNVALLLGITRLPATATVVTATIGGVEGTVIPIGSLATQPGSNINFVSTEVGIISRAKANSALITLPTFTLSDTYTISLDGTSYSQTAVLSPATPNTTEQIIDAFVLAIGTEGLSTHSYFVTKISPSSLSITSFDVDTPFSLTVSSNLIATNITSPLEFKASVNGPIAVPIGTLTQTVTSILGWNSITNLKDGSTGRNIETDAQLRLRRASAFLVGGYATVEAIRSHLLQDVPSVTSVSIIENRTMTQTPLTFSVNSDFIAGDLIDVTIDGVVLGQVAYNTYGTQLGTMNAIAALIATQAGVLTSTVSGTPYRSFTLTFLQGYQLTENNLVIERGVDLIPLSQSGGQPPKSFQAIVEGGTDQAVADNIWFTKPAGIETFGNTKVIIIDSMGNQQAIFFTRAEDLYIWIKVDAFLNPEEPLAGGTIAAAIEIIKDNIMLYGTSLMIGMDVINQRVMCRVIDVSGIGSSTVTMAVTNDLTPPAPGDYTSGNISIGDNQIANFARDRIFVTIT